MRSDARKRTQPPTPDVHHRLTDLADELTTTATTHLAADDERRAIVRRLRDLLRDTTATDEETNDG